MRRTEGHLVKGLLAVALTLAAGCGSGEGSGDVVVGGEVDDVAAEEQQPAPATVTPDLGADGYVTRPSERLLSLFAEMRLEVDVITETSGAVASTAVVDLLRDRYSAEEVELLDAVYLLRVVSSTDFPLLEPGEVIAVAHVPGVEQTLSGPAPEQASEPSEPQVVLTDMLVFVDASTGGFIQTSYIESDPT